MKLLIVICCVFIFGQVQSMTEKQIKSTANMIKNICQPKTKVTSSQIDNMHKGNFEEDTKAKCYMKCVFQTLQVMKNEKLDYDSALKQINTLPPRYSEASKITLDKCKDSLTNPDPCEAAYELAKCWYFSNPEYYFFP